MKQITNAEFIAQTAAKILDGSLVPETDHMGRISFHTDWFERATGTGVQSEEDPEWQDHTPESR